MKNSNRWEKKIIPKTICYDSIAWNALDEVYIYKNRNELLRQWNWIQVWGRQWKLRERMKRTQLSFISEWCRRIRTMEIMCTPQSAIAKIKQKNNNNNNSEKTAPHNVNNEVCCAISLFVAYRHVELSSSHITHKLHMKTGNRTKMYIWRDAKKERKKNKAIKTHIIYPNEVKWSCSETLVNLSLVEGEKKNTYNLQIESKCWL